MRSRRTCLSMPERAFSEQLREPARRRAARDLHLEEPVVGVQPAERRRGVRRRPRLDVGHRPTIPAHVDRRLQTGEGRAAFALRQTARLPPEVTARGERRNQEHDDEEETEELAEEHCRGVYRARSARSRRGARGRAPAGRQATRGGRGGRGFRGCGACGPWRRRAGPRTAPRRRAPRAGRGGRGRPGAAPACGRRA